MRELNYDSLAWCGLFFIIDIVTYQRNKKLIDPVTAIAGATAAYNGLKKMIAGGKEIERYEAGVNVSQI